MGGLNMDRGHKDLNEIVALIAKLPKTQKFREDPDFKALCLYLKSELQEDYMPVAINNMSKRISSYLMTHSYSSPKELVNLQKELLNLNCQIKLEKNYLLICNVLHEYF